MQVVGYDTGVSSLTYDPETGVSGDEEPPSLLIAHDETIDIIPLAKNQEITYTLQHRHCAGNYHNSTHQSCDSSIAPYCDVHTDHWPCARCTGQCNLPLQSCRKKHAVYLAGFAPDHFKVGVTKLHRLPTRLKEQGADKAAHIRTVSNGRIARQLENEIAASIPDRIPIDVKLNGIHQPVADDKWNALLTRFSVLNEFEFSYDLKLDTQPVPETIASGSIRGFKGRLVILDHANDSYAVDLRDLVGFEIERGRPDRELQSSFSAFD